MVTLSCSPMTLSLRHAVRCRTLWVLSVVAWLVLATTSSFASPMLSTDLDQGHGHAKAVACQFDHCCHDGSQVRVPTAKQGHGDGCCHGHASVVCHCDSLCGTAVISMPGYALFVWAMAPIHVRHDNHRASSRMLSPPLRPPAA